MKHIKDKKRFNQLIRTSMSLSVFLIIFGSVFFMTNGKLLLLNGNKDDINTNVFLSIILIMFLSDIIGILIVNMLFKQSKLAFEARWYKLKLVKKKKHLKGNISPKGVDRLHLSFSFSCVDEKNEKYTLYGDYGAYSYLHENMTALFHVKGDQILEVKVLKNKNEAIK